jgi:hypothetical protein
MAGYSGTPLPQKLGIKAGHRVAVVGAPPGFAHTLGDLPEGATLEATLDSRDRYNVILLFAPSRAALTRGFGRAVKRLDPSGGLWVAWPKKASGLATDLSEDDVRRTALAAGLVDNKVCAIDATWSGLRNVVRVADRPSPRVRPRPPRAKK